MLAAAQAAGKSETLKQYAADYPLDPRKVPARTTSRRACARPSARCAWAAHAPHDDHPVGFGLLRLRADLHQHFYGARRSVGYVPFNSESLVTGKLFEDIRDAVHAQADPATSTTPSSSSTCACPPPAACRCNCCRRRQRRAHHRHRRAGLRRAHPRRSQGRAGRCDAAYARSEAEAGPVAAPRGGVSDKPTVTLLGEMFPADPVGIGAARTHGPGRRAGGAHARMARAVCRAGLRGGGRDPPLLHRQRARVPAAGRVSWARRRWATTAPKPGCRPSARPAACRRR
jgi:chlorophyllide a reductase subunit Y